MTIWRTSLCGTKSRGFLGPRDPEDQKTREAFTSVEPGLQEATSEDTMDLAGADDGVLKERSPPRASTGCRVEPLCVTEAVT